jgi:YVTN family beta-propeller protein
MHDLPSGTVSFLFSDIEGSTSLLRSLGRERYREVLATHERLLREAFEQHRGREIGTEGDAFFVAFTSATNAVAAAAAGQRAIFDHPWPSEPPVRIRIGIHTGEVDVVDDHVIGLAIHRAKRICDAGHGGQILISEATRWVMRDEEKSLDVDVRDWGLHRLKDFDEPQRIFRVDVPGLAVDHRRPRTPRAQRAWRAPRLLIPMLAGVVAAAVAVPIFALGRGSPGYETVAAEGNSIGVVDPTTNHLIRAIAVGARPEQLAHTAGAVWVANLEDRTISKIDARTKRLIRSIPTGETPTSLAADARAVWVSTANSSDTFAAISRIDARYDSFVEVQRVPRASFQGGTGGSLAVGGGSVWLVAGSVGSLSRIDPATQATTTIETATCCPGRVAFGDGAAWLSDPYGDAVVRIDPRLLPATTTITSGGGPTAIAVGNGAAWIALSRENAVIRLNSATGAIQATIPVGAAPIGVAVGAGGVWVANSGDGTLSRISPRTNTVVATVEVGASPQDVIVANGEVWVTLQETAGASPAEVERGGVVHVRAASDVRSLDPALAYTPLPDQTLQHANLAWQIEYATCAKLLNHPDAPVPIGAQLEPEVAKSLPSVSRDGRTYTFHIRPGFRFSPPSGQRVTARTFKFAIERSLSRRMRGPARPSSRSRRLGTVANLEDVIGAKAFEQGTREHISGIVARAQTLTIKLTRPAPDLPARIALPFFCAVPMDTPLDPRGVRTVASAGPYYIAKYLPGHEIVLKRNPNYGGRRPHHLDEIQITLGESGDAVDAVKSGDADYVIAAGPRNDLPRAANDSGAGQLINPSLVVYFLSLNTSRPPFSDARVRQAASHAVDRRRLQALLAFQFSSQPTDQFLAPGMPGYRDVQIYRDRPDVARARHLLGPGRLKAVLNACDYCTPLAAVIRSDLAKVGIDVEIKTLTVAEIARQATVEHGKFDLFLNGIAPDYADPASVLNALFDGANIGTSNGSIIDDPVVNQRLRAAALLSGEARSLAYARLDAWLAQDIVPAIPLVVATRADFFSARIGCQVYNPVYGIDLAALCIRN